MYSLIKGVLPALALVVLSACAGFNPGGDPFEPPTIELVGFKPLKSESMEARFSITLRVVNPNAIALDIEGVYYELEVEGSKLLSGADSAAVSIPAYGEGRIELEGAASVLGSLGFIRNLMEQPPEQELKYELKTKISVAQLPRAIRINKEGSIGLGATSRSATNT